jgi:hypothetical protein
MAAECNQHLSRRSSHCNHGIITHPHHAIALPERVRSGLSRRADRPAVLRMVQEAQTALRLVPLGRPPFQRAPIVSSSSPAGHPRPIDASPSPQMPSRPDRSSEGTPFVPGRRCRHGRFLPCVILRQETSRKVATPQTDALSAPVEHFTFERSKEEPRASARAVPRSVSTRYEHT